MVRILSEYLTKEIVLALPLASFVLQLLIAAVAIDCVLEFFWHPN